MIIKTPFDIINILGKELYYEVPNTDKKRHAYIINRMLSRGLPDVSIHMSHMKVIPESTVDFWHQAFIDLGKSSHGIKKLRLIRSLLRLSIKSINKSNKSKIDSNISKQFMLISKIGTKEYQVLLDFYEKELIKYLKKFSKMLETTK